MYFTLYFTHKANIFTLRKIKAIKHELHLIFTMKEQLNLRASHVIKQKNYIIFSLRHCDLH
jgi:hypothetical protein